MFSYIITATTHPMLGIAEPLDWGKQGGYRFPSSVLREPQKVASFGTNREADLLSEKHKSDSWRKKIAEWDQPTMRYNLEKAYMWAVIGWALEPGATTH